MTEPPSPLTMLLFRHTRRREFMGLLSGVAAWPHGGSAQHRDRLRRIAALSVIAYTVLSSSSVPQESTQGADAASGRLLFNNACRTCHTTQEGDNRLGPNLHKIIGRKAGSLPNYGYSSAMKGADFVWDEEKLERFIANPDQMVPGNSMKPYGGLASAYSRAKVVAFLQSLTTGQ